MKRTHTSAGFSLMIIAAAMTMGGCNEDAADASAATSTASSEAAASQKQSFETIAIPTGTAFVASLDMPLSTDVNHSGDVFTATMDDAIVVGDRTLMPSGSKIHAVLQDVVASGRISGRAQMTLLYQSIVDPEGQRYPISAVPLNLLAASSTQGDIEKIAAGTVLGAIVGGVVDGGKGAAIGAGAGAGAGTIIMLATKGEDLALSRGQKLYVLTTGATSVQVASR